MRDGWIFFAGGVGFSRKVTTGSKSKLGGERFRRRRRRHLTTTIIVILKKITRLKMKKHKMVICIFASDHKELVYFCFSDVAVKRTTWKLIIQINNDLSIIHFFIAIIVNFSLKLKGECLRKSITKTMLV